MSSGLLGFLGLARRHEVRGAHERAAALKNHAAEITVSLESSRLDAERWKWKNEQQTARLKAATRDAERWKAKTEGLLAKLGRLETAEQNVKLARGHLMAMETKLDVIEAAINVLDRRTRGLVATSEPDHVATEPAATSHRE